MVSKEGYDVLRLIEHGRICYISSEYVEGEILAGWIKSHANITKEQLFSLIGDITKQLGMIHKCRKNPWYQYVNPYSIVVTEEGKTYFLDMEDSSNEERRRLMQRRSVREKFLPEKELYYQKASMELDIYGMGKTMQYLLSVSVPDPPLNRQEEKKFLKIISKCLNYQSKSSYQNMSEIRRHIPRYKEKLKYTHVRKGRIFLSGLAVILCVAIWNICGRDTKEVFFESLEEVEEEKVQEVISNDSDKRKHAENEWKVYMELAIVYILDVENYGKSLEYLREIEEEYDPARHLEGIAEALFALDGKADPDVLEENLKSLEEETPKDDILRYYHCLIKGYGLLDTEQSAREILRLGESCMMQPGMETREEKEIKEYMAAAREKTGEYEEAAHMYEEILAEETDAGKREEIYRKIGTLYEACGRNDMAMDTCIQGIEELEGSEELMILHIRLLCRDTSVERELCAQTIQEYIRRSPEILEKEEFQKLQREYEIHVEGENVWVGR